MDALIPFSIPIKGLRPGVHQFEFSIDGNFFRHFEHSPVNDGQVLMHMNLDKRPNLYILEFDFKGTVKTECDRCLAEIDLPVADQQRLMVKYSTEEEPEDAEVVFIHPETQQLNVAIYIYEFICLSIPMIRVYDCANDPNRVCNQEMLKYLQSEEGDQPAEEQSDNPIWDVLKDLKDEEN